MAYNWLKAMYTRPDISFYDVQPPDIPRKRPMKVLVVGLSRTAISTALKLLGMNPYHFLEASKNLHNGHLQLWDAALQAKYEGKGRPFAGAEDFDQMLGRYDAVTDVPTCLFVDELIAAYPEAKVVLTYRDPESWLKSMRQTILGILAWRSWAVLAVLDTEYSRPYWALFNRSYRVFADSDNAVWKESSNAEVLEFFDRHTAHVRSAVPEGNLLEFHPSQGWEPLCRFLEMPVPEQPFPHLNDTPFLITWHRKMYWWRWRLVLFKAMKVGGAAAALGIVGLSVRTWWSP